MILDENILDESLWNAIQSHNTTSPPQAIDIARVGDNGCPPRQTPDTAIVEWSITHNRIIISKDTNTLIEFFMQSVRRGENPPGLLIVKRGDAQVSQIVEYLVLVAHAGQREEFVNQYAFIP
jgi:predicted nuclease of predicted toxin-antitoxin system